MNASGTIKVSWELFRASMGVIAREKKLLLFPLMTVLCMVGIVLFFALPVLTEPLSNYSSWASISSAIRDLTLQFEIGDKGPNRTIKYALYAATYLSLMFVATFSNVAFYREVLNAFSGERVSVRAGFIFACRKWRSILLWTLLAGSVGLIIQKIEERLSWVGRFFTGFLGIAWSVASVFAIPVMIREEGHNPVTLLKKSALTLKKVWGETLVGYVGINLGGLIGLVFLWVLVGVVCLSALQPSYSYMAVPFTAISFCGFLICIYLLAVADAIYRCALYVYASEGVIPIPYTEEIMDAAWKVKEE